MLIDARAEAHIAATNAHTESDNRLIEFMTNFYDNERKHCSQLLQSQDEVLAGCFDNNRVRRSRTRMIAGTGGCDFEFDATGDSGK